MTTQNLTLLQAAMDKMRWHEDRQKILSQNIANANTPGYQPRDVKPLDFKRLLEDSTSPLSLTMVATNAKHIGLNGTMSKQGSYGTSLSGNSVSIEEQLLKMNENFIDHRLTTTIYQKNIDMLKSALRSQ